MTAEAKPRRVRADAERSAARILEAAEEVLAADPNASLEQIADAAGLTRVTVHRRFSSRQVLLEALNERFNERYLLALKQARVATAPPLAALHRATEIVLDFKLSRRAALVRVSDPRTGGPILAPEVVEGIELLFSRLHAAGVITAADPSWCSQVYVALLCEVERRPVETLGLSTTDDPIEEVGARTDLLTRTVLGALGGNGDALLR
ncbi:TetR/AcrR family transcriptional regulator [Amycolatopsis jiangsuensis]|uniref:AcrR family transcriptional regulator n=1 Tax=Amycolatopsis jiangsuensis TaxID=1181879 RepID=A0A840J412_9PSEU|nr:TetR/AcrR family transcriptional regulator [Amycolatopsis jiangsuensis]MBB4688142.1 AcrR family transcriptional regulator [Amycolatopsis jiangsuensis]